MKKINLAQIREEERTSPKGRYSRFCQRVSVALGSDPKVSDPGKLHPFDLMLARVPPGTSFCPYHSHSAQWEMYLIISGRGEVRDQSGQHEIESGDAFIYAPGEPHQFFNTGTADLVYHVIADNPPGDSVHYLDSNKWAVYEGTERIIVQGSKADYWADEE